MTAASLLRPRRVLHRLAGVALAVALLVAAVPALGPQRPPQLAADEVDAYTEAIAGIAESWGAIEVLGMRPAVTDLRTGEGVPAATIVTQATAWRSSFASYRRELDAMTVPAALTEAHRLFLAALERYDEAAGQFGDAAGRAARGVDFDIQPGIAAAETGAGLFDRAAAGLQEVRARAGLSPSPSFPSGLEADVEDGR